MMQPTLGIETSNPSAGAGCGVAIFDPRTENTDTEPLRKLERHDDDLVPAIRRLCERAGLRPGDLGAVGVSIGPGGYTGLRVACAVAKTIAESIGKPAAAVPTAIVVLASTRPELLPALSDQSDSVRSCTEGTAVLLAGKRGTAHATIFDHEIGTSTKNDQTSLSRWAIAAASNGAVIGVEDAGLIALNASGQPRTIIADTFAPADVLERARELGARVIGPRFDAGVCARLACDPVFHIDPALVVPLYAREPDAVTQWRERHGDAPWA